MGKSVIHWLTVNIESLNEDNCFLIENGSQLQGIRNRKIRVSKTGCIVLLAGPRVNFSREKIQYPVQCPRKFPACDVGHFTLSVRLRQLSPAVPQRR